MKFFICWCGPHSHRTHTRECTCTRLKALSVYDRMNQLRIRQLIEAIEEECDRCRRATLRYTRRKVHSKFLEKRQLIILCFMNIQIFRISILNVSRVKNLIENFPFASSDFHTFTFVTRRKCDTSKVLSTEHTQLGVSVFAMFYTSLVAWLASVIPIDRIETNWHS